jgi:DNA-binding NarL/FixJ family response regulator
LLRRLASAHERTVHLQGDHKVSHDVVVFVEDVFMTTKIRETAAKHRRDVRFIRDLGGLDKRLSGPIPKLVLLDLTAESLRPMELIQRVKTQSDWSSARLIAYASHSQAELMEQANQAGADAVMAKVDVAAQLDEILQGAFA